MSEDERVEFALAFSAKPDLHADDEEILNYLMEADSPQVLSSIALLTIRHSDKERAFRFLIQQIERTQGPQANFYQALELLGDRRAIPFLRREFEGYKRRLATNESDTSELVDYLWCCKVLFTLEGSIEYERAISELRSHSDEQISGMAARLLEK